MNQRHFFTYWAPLALSLACVAQNNQPTGGKTNWLDSGADGPKNGPQSPRDAGVPSGTESPELTETGHPTEPLGPIEAGQQAPSSQGDSGAEFSETNVLFSGTVSLECVEGDAPIAGDFALQAVVSREQDAVTGNVWGLPNGNGRPVAGSVSSSQTRFEAWNVHWPNSDLTALELSEVEFDAQHLNATVRGELEGVVGDIITSCVVQGELALERDHTPPTAAITPADEVVGFAPIVLDFNEPIGGNSTVIVRSNGENVERALTPEVGVNGFWSQITLTPNSAWPSGELTVLVEHMEDKGQNFTDVTFTLNVPERRSVTANPSFEDPLGDDSVWLGCENDSKITYTDWAQSPATEVEILPTDGATLAHCRGNGLLLQGYLEPPQGMTRLLIDVGNVDYSLGKGAAGVDVSFTCGDQRRSLLAVDPATDQTRPQFWTYAIDLEPEASDCWLQLDYQGGQYEEGTPSGAAFVDNLRFE